MNAGQDFDADGVVDTPADIDGDGRPDFQDLDSDNDGLHDLVEGSGFDPSVVDTNNDGVIDDNGTDADGDGIPDSIDTNDTFIGGISNNPADQDNDGSPDYRDLDSDGDGIFDLIEGSTVNPSIVDTDNNGILDDPIIDSDGDGIPDIGDANPVAYADGQVSTPVDTDGDNVPDYQDLDSDNDSLPDVTEAGLQDDDGDGLFDEEGVLLPILSDTDGDGIPNFQEVDSDNDGTNDIATTQEFSLDMNGDGMIDNITDADNDGVPDINDGLLNQHGTGNNENNEVLETAVTGSGGSTAPLGIIMMTLLLVFRRLDSMALLKRIFPILLVAFSIMLGLLPSTAVADTRTFTTIEERGNCGTGFVIKNGFIPCNYIAGGYVISHVDPEKKAGGFSTPNSRDNDMSNGFNLIVGRHFKPHWFGELSYADMGEAILTNDNPLIADETISYKVPSLHLGYFLRSPQKQLNFYLKGGISAIQNSASSPTVPYEKQTNVQLTFGLGAQWQSEDSGLFVRLGTDFFDRDAIAVGLNIGYKFGGSKRKVHKVVKRALVVPAYKSAPKPVVRVAKKLVVRKPVKVVKKACKVGVLEGVNFHTNSAALTFQAKAILKVVAHKLKQCRANRIVIIGHTDNVGSSTSNMLLSFNRAASVKKYLVGQGVRNSRLGTDARGESQPRSNNKTKEGKALNRRVELLTP